MLNSRGNVALIFALIATPIVGLIGASVELANLNNAYAKSQNILDAALLKPFSNYNYENDVEKVKPLVQEYIDSTAKTYNIELANLKVSKTVTGYHASANFSMPTYLIKIFGISELNGKIESDISINLKHLELAFVLDNSGSMEGNRITQLKSAVATTINEFQTKTSNFLSLNMSMVPYSSMVNVDPKNNIANFIDYNAISPAHSRGFSGNINRFNLYQHLNINWEGCVQSRTNGYDITDEPANQGSPQSLFVPWFWPDEPDSGSGTNYPNDYLNDIPTGDTIADARNLAKYGVNSSTPSTWAKVNVKPQYNYYSNYNTPQGPNFFCDSNPIIPLTSNYSEILTSVNNMKALGGTNLTEGLAWGWRTLSPAEPFTQGKNYSESVSKIIIFFTDGENAVNALSHDLGSENTTWGYAIDGEFGPNKKFNSNELNEVLDTKTAQVCKNIKADKIQIFVIGLDIKSKNAEDLLKSCASAPENFIALKDESELSNAFMNITKKLMQLHISG